MTGYGSDSVLPELIEKLRFLFKKRRIHMKTFGTLVTVLFIFFAFVCLSPAMAQYNYENYLRPGGSLNGQSINTSNPVINVSPGENPTNPDTDGDGLKDGEEEAYGTDPLLTDTDGDGYSDYEKIQAGSDPLDENSVPSGKGQDPPTRIKVGICDAACQATAPVIESGGTVEVNFNYNSNVNIMVGLLSSDFSQIWWLNDSCEFTTDYAQALSSAQTLTCSVTMPSGAENGWLFWMVTVENFSSLDWENGIYELLFYQWDFADDNGTCMEILKSEQQRDSSPDVPEAELAELVAGNSDFAFDLYQEVREGAENLFYSPHSISLALAMTYAGARNETESQMADTLHFRLTQAHLHPAFNALDLELASRGEGAEGQDGKGFRLNIVNSIWGQTGYPFLPGFLDALAENYGAGLRLLDFQNAPEDSRVCINNWVSDQTEDRINDLIPQGSITSLTVLVLTNAIYFNAAWLYPFDEELTQDGTFHLPGGSHITVPMMSQTEHFRYASGDGYQVVELPYDGEELSMVVFLPESDRFDDFETSLDAGRVEAIIDSLSLSYLRLSVPRFKYEWGLGLVSTLKAMGMIDHT
jgi:serpin B